MGDQQVGEGTGTQDVALPLLSVGELQQALRMVIEGRARQTATASRWVRSGPNTVRAGDTVRAGGAGGTVWIAVVGAEAGAGCSTVALLLADALAVTGTRVHLIEVAETSGLAGVTDVELGTDPTGVWRRGTRGGVTVDRPAARAPGAALDLDRWPAHPEDIAERGGVAVVDLGVHIRGASGRFAPGLGGPPRAVALVTRGTAPGMAAAEQALSQLRAPHQACLAVVGVRRHSGELWASGGPHVNRLKGEGRVVAVPVDRRLEATGLTTAPLPRCLDVAAEGLARLVRPIDRSAPEE